MTRCRFALAVRTFGRWLTTGSKLVRDWLRAGSGLDQVWFKVGWLVPGWFPNGSLLLSCRLTAITLVSVAFLQLILCYFVALPWFRGRWGAGSQLVRNWLGAGSSLAQGRFPAGRTWPTVRKTPSTPGNVTVTLKVPRVSASSLGNGHYAALRMFCSVPLYSDLLAEAVQLHAALVRERQVRLSFKWRGRPSAGGKLVLKVLRGKALQGGFGANGRNPLCFCPVLRGSQRTQRAQTGAESLRQTLNGPAGRETEKQSGTNARETKRHRTQTHAQT